MAVKVTSGGASYPVSLAPGVSLAKSNYDPARNTYNVSATNLARWRAAVSGAVLGTGVARCIFMGDSTTSGYNTGSTVPLFYGVSRTLPVTNATVKQAFPGMTQDSATGWTLGGGWGPGYGIWSGGGSNSTTTNAVSRTDTCLGYDIYQLRDGAVGSANLDGGAATTLTAGSGSSFIKYTLNATLGSHTLSITRTSGLLGFGAIDPIQPNGTIVMYDGGLGGKRMSDLAAASAQYYDTLPSLTGMIPYDLVVLNFGINDFVAQTDPVTGFRAAGNTVLSAITGTRDVLLVVPVPPGRTVPLTIPWSKYVEQIYYLADQYNLPLLDLSSRYGGLRTTMPAVFSATSSTDELHMSQVGYIDMAHAHSRVLAPV